VPSPEHLRHGEHVVVRDAVGDFFAAVVAQRAGSSAVELRRGVRLPAAHAWRRTRGTADEQLEDVLDLLGQARDALHLPVPRPRKG
jgi:hypothetical protein